VVILLGSFALSASLFSGGCASDNGVNEAKDARKPADAPAAPPALEGAKPQPVELDEAELEEEMPAAEEARSRRESKPSRTLAPGEAPEKKKESKADALDSTRSKDGEADFDAGADELARLQSQLVSLEGELRQAGVPIPAEGALAANLGGEDVTTAKPGTAVKCEKACELTEAICGLADNICGLRERHPEDERYVNACERAKGDCQLGRRSCDTCSGG
jgi:hypothetical protein